VSNRPDGKSHATRRLTAYYFYGSQQQLDLLFLEAQRAGLKVHAIPLRCAGPVCSIYAPETRAFFLDAVERLLRAYPVAGIIWDEIKVLPDIALSCFVYAHMPDEILRACAGMDGLDSFGIDGHCWPDDRPRAKTLVGNLDRAAAACRARGRRLLALIETQLQPAAGWAQRTLEHLPALLEQPLDDVYCYYHGASATDDAGDCMERMKPHLSRWRTGHG
jgi:hypothetical protein